MSRTECLTRAREARQCSFRRILLVHTGEDPEVDLLDYTAMLFGRETTVAAYPFDGVLRSLAATARMRFEVNGSVVPNLRALPALDLDWVLDVARDADLLVMRQGNAFGRRQSLIRQILSKSPCPVCLVPERLPSRLERILVGIKPDAAGRVVLERAAATCRSVGAEELTVVYCCSPDVYLDFDDAEREQFRSDRTLELYRFLARCNLQGVSCTTVVEESMEPRRALARVARERSADMVLVGRRQGLAPRVAAGLVEECSAPVMQVLLPAPEDGVLGKLRRMFSNPEPKFG